MKVTSEQLADGQVCLRIEVEPERATKAVDQAYRRLVGRLNIPGFRKGKAPRQVVERMVGHEALVHEGIELLVPEVIREAVDETGIDPVVEPKVEVEQESPLVLNVTVAVRPTVELGDYHEVSTTRDQVSVRDDEVESVMQGLREQHAEWLPVERAVAAGDRVTIDVTGHVRGAPVLYNPSGAAILETGTGELVIDQKGAEYTVTPGSGAPVEGFAEQIVGMQAGDRKRFEITFPASHPDRKLANKSVIFEVTVHTVKEKQLPELGDDFAKTAGNYETLAALRDAVRDGLQRQAEREADDRLRERVYNMVADRARLDLPPALVERETDRLVERAESRMREQNVRLEEYLRVAKKSKDDLISDHRADAIASLRRYFILEEVAKAENITVSPQEVDAEIERIAQALGDHGQRAVASLRSPEQRESIAAGLLRSKALSRLVEIATGAQQLPAGEPAPPEESRGDTTAETSGAR